MNVPRLPLARAVDLGIVLTSHEVAAIACEALAHLRAATARGGYLGLDACVVTGAGDVELEDEAVGAPPESVARLVADLVPACPEPDQLEAAAAGYALIAYLDDFAQRVSAERRRTAVAGVTRRALALQSEAAGTAPRTHLPLWPRQPGTAAARDLPAPADASTHDPASSVHGDGPDLPADTGDDPLAAFESEAALRARRDAPGQARTARPWPPPHTPRETAADTPDTETHSAAGTGPTEAAAAPTRTAAPAETASSAVNRHIVAMAAIVAAGALAFGYLARAQSSPSQSSPHAAPPAGAVSTEPLYSSADANVEPATPHALDVIGAAVVSTAPADRTYLEIVVGRAGAVENVQVRRPVDAVEPSDHYLSVVNAARQWQFTPARRDGRPVRYLLYVVVT